MILIKAMTWSPVAQVLILSFGVLSSFVVAYAKGHVNQYLPFVSETGAYSPEMCLFSMTLYLGSFIGFWVFLMRYLLLSYVNDDEVVNRINFISFIIGCIAMLGLAGVAALPMTTILWAHLIAAGMYFCGSALYFACSTFITWRTERLSKKFILRCILSILLFILLFFLVICFPIALHNWHSQNTTKPAMKEPGNKGFALVLFSSILEWSIVSVIVLFTLTFVTEMRNHGLMLTISPIKNESNSPLPVSPEVAEPPVIEQCVPESSPAKVKGVETPI